MIASADLVFRNCTYGKTNLISCVFFGFYSLNIIVTLNKKAKKTASSKHVPHEGIVDTTTTGYILI